MAQQDPRRRRRQAGADPTDPTAPTAPVDPAAPTAPADPADPAAPGAAEDDDADDLVDDAGDNPEETVRQKERELEIAKTDLAFYKEKLKRKDEIAKVIDDYELVQVDLEAVQEALEEHRRDELNDLQERLTATEMQAVVDLDQTYADDEAALNEVVKDLEEILSANRDDLSDKREHLEKLKKAYEAAKAILKELAAKNKAADGLRKEALEARNKNKLQLAYYVVRFKLLEVLENLPKPVEVRRFARSIRRTSGRYGRIAREVADLDASIKAREKMLADAQKLRDEFHKTREARIRAALADLAVN